MPLDQTEYELRTGQAVKTVSDFIAPETFPTFKPRRSLRLDLRPAIWSLRNRPEEWEVERDHYNFFLFIKHLPSNHKLYVGAGTSRIRLEGGDCSCNERNRARWLDRRRFYRAFRNWHYAQEEARGVNRQFAAHFFIPRGATTST